MKKLLLSVLLALPIASQAGNPLETCKKALETRDYATAAQTASSQDSYDGVMCAGRAQQAIGDHSAAESSFGKAEKLANDKYSSMLAITFLARSANSAGKPDEALSHYERSLKLAREISAQQGQWVSLNEMGQIHQERKDFKAALDLYKKASPFASNDNERSESNQLIAAACDQSGDHDHAIEYQLKSVVLEERSGDANQYLNAKLQLALYAIYAKEYNRSNKELSDIIKVSKEGGSLYWEARATLYQSRIEKSRGDQDKSDALLKVASDLASKSGIPSLIEEVGLETQR
jgi:tetratricopeptide (TPR) repeat protein